MQPQIQVDTATLKAVLKRDIETVSNKKAAYDKQIKGLDGIISASKSTHNTYSLLGVKGVLTYLYGLRAVAACEANLMDRQLATLKERLSRVESDIITPGPVPGVLTN